MKEHLVPCCLAVVILAGCQEEPLEDFTSNLPIVMLDTDGVKVDAPKHWEEVEERQWIPVDAVFVDVDDTGVANSEGPAQYAGRGGLHVRGSSSAEEYEKKSYALETWDDSDQDQDVSLLGLPAEEDWVLQGPFADKTLMRNHLIYSWSNDIGRYAARTRFCEVFVDDDQRGLSMADYRGVYVFMEKVKRDDNRVDLQKLDPSHDTEPEITGGYLLKRDWELDDPEFYVVTETYEDVLQYVDPDGPEITGAQRSYLKGYLDEFEEVLAGPDFADPQDGYAKYIDVDTFVDHLLLVELGRNVDGYVLSTFLFKDRGGKLSMGAIWDYNGALGNADYFEADDPEGWHYENPEFPEDNPTGWSWYERLLEDPAFRQRIAERWAQHRAGPWATDNLMERIDADAALLAEPAARNFERWEILGEYVWPNAEPAEEADTFEAQVDYLKSWLDERLEWMDGAVLDY